MNSYPVLAQVLMPVPRDLPLPLPLPEITLQILVVPAFLLHILFVNLTVGAAVLSALFEYMGLTRPRYDRLALRICQTITVNKSLAVVLGIAPLLMMNLLYTAQFYAANALTGHAWVMLIPMITAAFLLSYLHQYTWRRWSGSRKPLHILTGAASALLFLAIPLIFLSNVNLMLLPAHWSETGGFFSSLQFGNVFPRYFHFLGASLALTSLFLAARFGWRSYEVGLHLPGFSRDEVIRLFYSCAFFVTAAQLAFGPLLLLTMDWSHVQRPLLLMIGLALCFAAPALWLLRREMRSAEVLIGARYAVIVLCLSATILGMGTGRHLYREAALAGQRHQIADRTVEFAGVEQATQMRLKAGLGAGESTLGPRSGKTVYDQICSNCHQLHEATNAPALTEIYSLYHNNPAGIVAWAKSPGKKRAQYTAMPSMGHLDPEELNKVAEFMLQAAKPPAASAQKPGSGRI